MREKGGNPGTIFISCITQPNPLPPPHQGAESQSCGRTALVSELQQSNGRLTAAATIIRQQLQQLSSQLLTQRQQLLEERSSGRSLQGRGAWGGESGRPRAGVGVLHNAV